jgi:hypothetical protein
MKIRVPHFRGPNMVAGDDANPPIHRSDEAVPQPPVIHIDGVQLQRMLADIATNAWKAQVRLKQWPADESSAERRRLERNVDAIVLSLYEFGVRVKDHTGESYDYGQAIKVVAAQPQAGIEREVVIETIRPSVLWGEHLVQRGEVVIATPAEGQQ